MGVKGFGIGGEVNDVWLSRDFWCPLLRNPPGKPASKGKVVSGCVVWRRRMVRFWSSRWREKTNRNSYFN